TLNGSFVFAGGTSSSEFVIFGELGPQTAVRTINVTGSVFINTGGGGDDPRSTSEAAGPPDAVSTGGTDANNQLNAVVNVGGNFTVLGATLLALRGTIWGSLFSNSASKTTGQEVI